MEEIRYFFALSISTRKVDGLGRPCFSLSMHSFLSSLVEAQRNIKDIFLEQVSGRVIDYSLEVLDMEGRPQVKRELLLLLVILKNIQNNHNSLENIHVRSLTIEE